MSKRLLTGLLAAVIFALPVAAQDLQKSHFKVIGLNSPTPASIY